MQSLFFRRFVWTLLVAALVFGCASRPPSLEEQRAFAAAEREVTSDPRKGRAALEAFLEKYGASSLAVDAKLALGDLDHAEGDSEGAIRRFTEVVALGGAAGDRGRVRLAMLALENDERAAARRWLEPVRLSRLEGSDLRNAYRGLAESAPGPAQRLRWLGFLRSEVEGAEALVALDLEIDGILAEATLEELQLATRSVGNRPPLGRIHLVLAERALAARQLDLAHSAFEQAKRNPLAPRYAPRLAALEARLGSGAPAEGEYLEVPTFAAVMDGPLPEWSGAVGVLGVVLPLSGPYAHFGELALQGILLATGAFPESGRIGPQVVVRVRDSQGDPKRAAAAVRELAGEGDVVAIVGPLVSSACEAAAREADEVGIPLLALSARSSVAENRPWVFRMRTQPADQTELLAERAASLGIERFGILYPDSPSGLGMRRLFWDAVEARGGRVVAVSSFDPKSTDIAGPIRELVGYTLLSGEQKRQIARREEMREKAKRLPPEEARALRAEARALTAEDGSPIPPIVDFDMLFLPASHEQVVLIAAQLAFHEVTGIRLVGTDAWTDRDLLRVAGRHVEGAIFASYFHPESSVPYVREFTRRFEGVFGEAPEAFSAQSYDAASLVLLQIAQGRRDRDSVREGILREEGFPGVSAVMSMQSDGNARKRPFLMGVESGRLVQYTD